MFFTGFALYAHVQVRLLINQAATAFFTLYFLFVRYSFLSAVFQTSRCQSEVAFLC